LARTGCPRSNSYTCRTHLRIIHPVFGKSCKGERNFPSVPLNASPFPEIPLLSHQNFLDGFLDGSLGGGEFHVPELAGDIVDRSVFIGKFCVSFRDENGVIESLLR